MLARKSQCLAHSCPASIEEQHIDWFTRYDRNVKAETRDDLHVCLAWVHTRTHIDDGMIHVRMRALHDYVLATRLKS